MKIQVTNAEGYVGRYNGQVFEVKEICQNYVIVNTIHYRDSDPNRQYPVKVECCFNHMEYIVIPKDNTS